MNDPSAHIIIDPLIEKTSFACDLDACKGACCTLAGGRGAPLLDHEVELIWNVLPAVLPKLDDQHRSTIDAIGPIEGTPGDYHTTCVDHRACVFVRYDGPIARCAIEQAFHHGEINWRKPISCHLFPIRADRGPLTRLRFEYIPECLPAIRRGHQEHISLLSFVSDALEHAFGEDWSDLREGPDQ